MTRLALERKHTVFLSFRDEISLKTLQGSRRMQMKVYFMIPFTILLN